MISNLPFAVKVKQVLVSLCVSTSSAETHESRYNNSKSRDCPRLNSRLKSLRNFFFQRSDHLVCVHSGFIVVNVKRGLHLLRKLSRR